MNKKKTGIVIILVLISLLILLFSYFDLKKYDSKKANTNVIENIEKNEIKNDEIVNEIKENDIKENNIEENIIEENITQTNTSNETISNTTKKEENQNNDTKDSSTKKDESVTKKENIKPTPTPTPTHVTTEKTKKVIVIDPGHQRKGDNSKEPIGPGATETKAKVTTGATGVSTKQLESKLNLDVSLLLKKELEKRGYTAIMTRTSQNVNISNSERAKIANNANADAFVRIHADSSTSSSATGMSTLCQTIKNKYNGNIALESYNLSKYILDNMVKQTGAKNRGVTRTDTMSGINWATVPTTIIEMGFLSNPEEDKLLASNEYQQKIVKGIANGIDEFLK